MAALNLRSPGLRPSLPFVLIIILFGTLLIGGGASRADVLGQAVVRLAAWLIVVALALQGARPALGTARPLLALLTAALAFVLLQLVPLPPALWQLLPGRAIVAQAATVSGQPQPWRPWSIVPGATINAAGSLIVPFATLFLVSALREQERQLVPSLLLGAIFLSTVTGLLQFSGGGLDNPLVNETVNQVSGTFANRNHFALFLAIGCLLAPAWALAHGHRPGWRAPVALGLGLLFVLTLLATGSRAGLALGALGAAIGMTVVHAELRRMLRRYPRWAVAAFAIGVIAIPALAVLVSVAADRAMSIDRLFAIDPGQDMRTRGLPTVWAMVSEYWPVGAGFGGFEPLFRLHEPFVLLKPTYFNHAHNDLIEVALDGGLPGVVLLLAGCGWWALASVRVWRKAPDTDRRLARLGSAVLLLILVASAFDYPARTPMMMAVAVVAGMWLARGAEHGAQRALPSRTQHL